MKQVTTHHEILLFTGTTHTNREFCSRDEENNWYKTASAKERLEKACWDGMLYEMFPEILGSFSAKCESFIWHIMSGKNYLRISMGPASTVMENETTIDPYFFMLSACEN